MKKLFWVALPITLIFFQSAVFAQQQQSKSAQSASTRMNAFPQEQPQAPVNDKNKKKGPQKQTLTNAFSAPYTLPGIVGIQGGKWVGADNLYNMKPAISIYVEIVKPENKKFDLDEKVITDTIMALFAKAAISTPAMHESDEPSLPLYHVIIMVNSIEQFIVANVDCRLFEPVTLKRVFLDPGITFQAITWEKQELVATPRSDSNKQILSTVVDLTSTFIERYNFSQLIRNRQAQ